MKKMTINSAMEYKLAFGMQIVAMILNNSAFLLVWYFFFQTVPDIQGWQMRDSFVLFCFSSVVFGLLHIIFRGVRDITQIIADGSLDQYLLSPQPLIWNIMVAKTEVSAIGDLCMGILGILLLTNMGGWEFIRFLLMLIPATSILGSAALFVGSLGFYIPRFDAFVSSYTSVLYGFGMYPTNSFSPILRVITYTVLPAAFMYSIPKVYISNPEWWHLLVLGIASVGLMFIARWMFYKGLRRYESGNLIGIRG